MTTTDKPRVHAGVPSGGEFAATAHSDSVPALGGSTPENRFAAITDVRELDAAASAALVLDDSAVEQDAAVRAQWTARRKQIMDQRQRRIYDDYATSLEDQANTMLRNAARANLRNVADELREAFPEAATMVLEKDYDDGDLAIWVASVQDKDGNDLPDPEDGSDDARDTAQELVSQHSSRQLARFTEGPVDLAKAAAWYPDGGLRLNPAAND
jgi:hypothetical protein